MEINKLKLFYDKFSLITVGENKVPNFSWKDSQSKKIDWGKFQDQFNYKGGIIKKDGTELTPTANFGIVTGFEFLEVIDIDLKVFSTAKEKLDFWNEYIGYLKDNILDFDDKLVIYKTKNAGYHILYKSKRVEGNLKLAKLKGHKEAVIETRGIGGYVFAYPENNISKKTYKDVDFISDEDRFVLMSFSKMYNYVDEQPILPKKEPKVYQEGEITCWDDYNEKTDIFDVIQADFTIVGNHKDKYIIKRHNSESPHSGYVYKSDNLMYLYSTATIYPHETQLTPFAAYAWKNYNGDFSATAKDIYGQGFGSRLSKVVEELKKSLPDNKELINNYNINKDDLVFPIDIFPESMQSYIIECKETLNSSTDYMGCSLLWLISVSIGNSMQIEVKTGWREVANIWISVVGKAGIGKTPSISNMIFPLKDINNREIKRYLKEREKYDFYEKLTKKEKEEYSEVQKPKKTQFIADNITLEALVDLHQDNDNAVGVFKDELAGWFKEMNQYRSGSDLEFWLSTWSGSPVSFNRLTRPGSFVDKPFIPVIGGIQPSILTGLYTEENKENGFIDRMLLCYPDLAVDDWNDREMDFNTIEWYKNTIVSFYDTVKLKLLKYDNDFNIIPNVLKFDAEAKKEWIRIFNEISKVQNSDEENEYMKSMLPKQKSYIPRFSLLIHVFNGVGKNDYDLFNISKDSILKAEKLSKYFIASAKKIKINSIETGEIKKVIKDNYGKNKKDIFLEMYKFNPAINKKEVAEILGVSLQMIYKYMK